MLHMTTYEDLICAAKDAIRIIEEVRADNSKLREENTKLTNRVADCEDAIRIYTQVNENKQS